MLLHYTILGLALAWTVIFVGCWLGWQLLRQNGRLLLRIEELEKRLDTLEFGEDDQPTGLPVGSEAPAFELPDLAGNLKNLGQYRGQPVLLIFFNPECGFCRDLVPRLADMQRSEVRSRKPEDEGHSFLLIITTGDAEANRQLFNEHQLTCPVLLQKEMEVATAYKANGTPSGYLISSEGKISSGLAIGAQALLDLLSHSNSSFSGRRDDGLTEESQIDQSLVTSAATGNNGHNRESRFGNRSLARSKIKRDGLKAGTPAPDFRLPRLDGHGELTLSELRGRPVLLMFSSPSCGPCNTLAPELEKFHREHPDLEVVMISKGEPKENRAKVKQYGLTFPIVLQQQWEVSRRYAMFATPIAYLIDEAGVIVHDVSVGSDAILGLLGGQNRQIGRGNWMPIKDELESGVRKLED